MENCDADITNSVSAENVSDLMRDGTESVPLVDMSDGECVGTAITPMPSTEKASESLPKDERSDVVESGQISLNQITDGASNQDRAASVSSDSDSDASSSSTDSDSSDDSLNIEIRQRTVGLSDEIDALKNSDPPKVDGEILIYELPPVEDLHIVLPEHAAMHAFGRISQIMEDNSVVIQSYVGMPALDHDTVLFFAHRKAIGKVEETFGPVPSPYYIVRFNSKEHLLSKEVELEKEVFYAPDFHDLTSYVFLSTLQKMRGSDASWLNDKEPPPNFLDYSDDEEERREKKLKNRGKNKAKRDRSAGTAHSAVTESENVRILENQDRWHNASHRVNVLPLPNPAFEGWNAAVNRMSVNNRMRPAYPYSAPVFGQPTSMNGMPVHPMRAPHPFHNSPYMNHSYFRGSGHGEQWPHCPQQFNGGRFPHHPPPPPPPPPPNS